MDSEEEYEELNGEDINNSDNDEKEDEDEEMDEDETPGWIVPDGYLSDEEKKLGREEEENEVEVVKKQNVERTKPSGYETQTLKPKVLLPMELDGEILKYTIQILPSRKF